MIVMMLSLGASEGLRYITDRLLGPPDAAFGPGAARRRWPAPAYVTTAAYRHCAAGASDLNVTSHQVKLPIGSVVLP